MHVVGLARVIPGTLCDGPCTDWNVEEQLCWSLIDFADDAASVQVLDYAQALNPLKVEAYMASVSSPTTQINLSVAALRVGHALLSIMFYFSDGKTTVTGFEVARRWSVDQALRCKSMVVPSAVASSILCGSFTRLMSTARQMRKQKLLFEVGHRGAF